MYANFLRVFAFMSVALAAMALAPGADAAKLQPAVIAYLDSQKILRESIAAASIRKQIDAYRVTYRSEVAESEKRLRKEEAELTRQRPILSVEAFAVKRRGFEDSIASVQRIVQNRTRMLDRSFSVAMRQVDSAIRKIVSGLASEYGFNIVLERRQILFAHRDLDITKVVLEKLNATLPDIKVPVPTGKPTAPAKN
jgi:Skp family chaperone for outer membrane proteins